MPKIRLPSQSSSENPSPEDGQISSQNQDTKPAPTHRELGNWLAAYGEYVKESESPEDFHLWTGLSVLASAVRRNIWLNQGIYILWPNLYVILIGPPGIAKSTSIRMGRKILLGVEDIIFGPDSVTREELIRIMARVGKKDKQSALTIHSSELSSLIDPSGVKMIQFLTEIYDGDFQFRYSTKGSGRDTIHNPVLNILAGTTPTWIAEGLPSTVVGHGFTSRIIFVFGDKPRYLKPFPKEPDSRIVSSLVNDLDYISRIEGEFEWGEGSMDYYAQVYEALARTRPKDYRIEGFHARKKNHLLKVAMLLSIADRDDLVLEVKDLKTAKKLLDSIEPNMHKAFSAIGKYDHASDLERVRNRIFEEGGMTAQQIHEEFYAVGDVQEIAKILQMLLSMGAIARAKDEKGQSIYIPTRRGSSGSEA